MDLLAIWYALIGLVGVMALSGAVMVVRGERRSAARAKRIAPVTVAVALGVCGGGAVAWEELALSHFAREVGGDVRGMIGGPVPNGGGSHEFTTRGQHYQRWIFEVPLCAGVATIVVTLIVGTAILYRLGHRETLIGIVLWGVSAVAAVLMYSIVRYLDTFEVFI